ncbi:RNA-binding protein [Microbispora bryophytorum]|uniref:RNA-binding protein n=1 Tax=Microbispora bryophytorum TaxID=1460882 RepID=UPI0033DF7958
MLPYVYRVTKYDPADRNEHGHYTGTEDVYGDHGPMEAAYLTVVAAFAEEADITCLAIREPAIAGQVNFGIEAPIDGHGLADLFPPNLTGYHDGARIPVATGLDLVRAMLRDNGAWCRLEAEDRFFVHVGYDQYIYVGSAVPCPHAVVFTHAKGLFAEPIVRSPYDPELDQDATDRRSADAAFWAELGTLAAERGAVILEEGYLHNASRWHRITPHDLAAVRARLAPRARLLVWPDLSANVQAVVASLPAEGLSEVVWQELDGHITSRCVDETDYPALPALLAEARGAMALSAYEDDRHPLLTAVLPDPDGILRARWAP